MELTKKKSQTERILDLLVENSTVTNVDLNRICYRYSARLHELRKEGHKIARSYIKPGVWSYTYIGQVDDSN